MGVRVKKHSGPHSWVLKSATGVCRSCQRATGRILRTKMKWECSVENCKATKTTKHAHIV